MASSHDWMLTTSEPWWVVTIRRMLTSMARCCDCIGWLEVMDVCIHASLPFLPARETLRAATFAACSKCT